MYYSMRQTLGTRVEQRQEVVQSLSMQLQQRMDIALDLLWAEGGEGPQVMIGRHIDRVLSHIADDGLRSAAKLILEDPHLSKILIEKPGEVVSADPAKLRALCAERFYAEQNGVFLMEEGGKVEDVKIPLDAYIRALNSSPDPERRSSSSLESQLALFEETRETVAREGGDTTGVSIAIRECKAAMAIRDSDIKEMVNRYSQVLKFALEFVAPGSTNLVEFFRDFLVYRSLRFGISDRIVGRFIAHCKARFNRKDSYLPEDEQNGLLNVIGEYVLVGLGVLHPDIFTLNSQHVSEESYGFAREELAKIGMDLEKLVKSYQLSAPGTLFWTSYRANPQVPYRLTHDSIMAFIHGTVWAEREQLLSVIDFEGLRHQIRRIKDDYRGEEEEIDAKLKELCVNTLTDSAFIQYVIERAKSSWNGLLSIFYSDPSQWPR